MTVYNDRLYRLIPAIYRIRDEEIGEPLRALLSAISAEVDVVERDIEQLYENWFIETCDEWAVPYIGDLVGHDAVLPSSGEVTDPRVQARNRWLFPRREIANIVRYRRRKGTLPVLEELAQAVAGWPAWAEETRHEVAAMGQPDINLIRKLPDLRAAPKLRLGNLKDSGLPHPRRVRLTVWQLPVYSTTNTEPASIRHLIDGQLYTFASLDRDVPLFNKPQPETPPGVDADPPVPADSLTDRVHKLPVPITREMLRSESGIGLNPRFYGSAKALVIRLNGTAWKNANLRGLPFTLKDAQLFQDIPWSLLGVADLSDDKANAALATAKQANLAGVIDPETGRFGLLPAPPPVPANPPAEPQRKPPPEVRVTFHYAQSGDIGGGEYQRPSEPQRRPPTWSVSPTAGPVRVGGDVCRPAPKICELVENARDDRTPFDRAIEQLAEDLKRIKRLGSRATPEQRHLILELSETGVYRFSKEIDLHLPKQVTVEIRAGRSVRPIVRASSEVTALVKIALGVGAKLILDGLTIASNAEITVDPPEAEQELPADKCSLLDPSIPDPRQVFFRHCTLVSSADQNSLGRLKMSTAVANLCVDHSIVGQVSSSNVPGCPPVLSEWQFLDSIVSSIGEEHVNARCRLSMHRSTVFQETRVQQIEQISNSLLAGSLSVTRASGSEIRYSGLRLANDSSPIYQVQSVTLEDGLKAEDLFESTSLTHPGFTRLRRPQAAEKSTLSKIRTGADDGGEMGAFHDQFVPHRERALERRLEEFTPATHDIVIDYRTSPP